MLSPALERVLAHYCAPTLLGAKAAGLIALPDEEFPNPKAVVRQCAAELENCGLRFALLCRCPRRCLLLVYRPQMLAHRLHKPQAQRILRGCGYPEEGGLGVLLAFLQRRLAKSEGFPHEIGLFLDYPPADVEGFIRSRGEACKLCGHWKVYSDVEEARSRFACYDTCRQCLCRAIAAGTPLIALLKAA